MIFKRVIGKGFDLRLVGDEIIIRQPHVAVAYVLRRHRQQDAFIAAVRKLAGKRVEQHKEGGLAAGSQDNVLRPDIPPVLASEHLNQHIDKTQIALWRTVVADEF